MWVPAYIIIALVTFPPVFEAFSIPDHIRAATWGVLNPVHPLYPHFQAKPLPLINLASHNPRIDKFRSPEKSHPYYNQEIVYSGPSSDGSPTLKLQLTQQPSHNAEVQGPSPFSYSVFHQRPGPIPILYPFSRYPMFIPIQNQILNNFRIIYTRPFISSYPIPLVRYVLWPVIVYRPY